MALSWPKTAPRFSLMVVQCDEGVRSMVAATQRQCLGFDAVLNTKKHPPGRSTGRVPQSIVLVRLPMLRICAEHVRKNEPKSSSAFIYRDNMDPVDVPDVEEKILVNMLREVCVADTQLYDNILIVFIIYKDSRRFIGSIWHAVNIVADEKEPLPFLKIRAAMFRIQSKFTLQNLLSLGEGFPDNHRALSSDEKDMPSGGTIIIPHFGTDCVPQI